MKPMLAESLLDVATLRLPCYASDKEDGIRCLLMESVITAGRRIAYSRSLKPIANAHIRATLEQSTLPLGIDGELIVGDNFQQTASGVMSVGGEPDFKYRVFDWFGDGNWMPYVERYAKLTEICAQFKHYSWLELLPHKLITTLDELAAYETDAIARGKEGVMLRAPQGRYKWGRSTLTQQWLLKLKRFVDSDAQVIGFAELMHNTNDMGRDSRGYAERSDCIDGLVAGGMLGSLHCRDLRSGKTFNIGTGFTHAQRIDIWRNQSHYLHKKLSYKSQDFGVKDAPRCPVFLRWRPDL